MQLLKQSSRHRSPPRGYINTLVFVAFIVVCLGIKEFVNALEQFLVDFLPQIAAALTIRLGG